MKEKRWDIFITDIEQVQSEKNPFTLRCMPYQTIQRHSGEVRRWNRCVSNAESISGSLLVPSKT
jgi:hypothetical protein